MVFVRVKRIKGQPYAYLVENTWTAKGPRQKVGKYLGKVLMQETSQGEYAQIWGPLEQAFAQKSFAEIVRLVVIFALESIAFTKEGEGLRTMFKGTEIKVDPSFTITEGKKPGVIGLNKGYVCAETVAALLSYEGKEDPNGATLARRILACGLPDDQDLFVELFAKSHSHEQGETVIEY